MKSAKVFVSSFLIPLTTPHFPPLPHRSDLGSSASVYKFWKKLTSFGKKLVRQGTLVLAGALSRP